MRYRKPLFVLSAFLLTRALWTENSKLIFVSVLILLGLLIEKNVRANRALRSKKTSKKMPKLTNQKEHYYTENGLSKSEIGLFRQTMQTAKDQIIQLEEHFQNSTKLKAIDLHHDTLSICKHFFQLLTKEPLRLTDANTFLYTDLPSIVELTENYLELEQHEVKNPDTYRTLQASAQTIDGLALKIREDYQHFLAEDFEEYHQEINYAKQQLKK